MTPIVATEKMAELLPAATVTEPGTVAAALPLERETIVPGAPAGPESDLLLRKPSSKGPNPR